MMLMMMRDSLSLQGVSNEQDYDAQHDVAEHPGCAVTQFCDWKALSSVLTYLNLLQSHQYSCSTLSRLMKIQFWWRWFGGTFYFKTRIDFSYIIETTEYYGVLSSSLSKQKEKKKEYRLGLLHVPGT